MTQRYCLEGKAMKPRVASNSEFRFNSGRLSLDLAATVRRRGSTPKGVLSAVGAAGRGLLAAGLCEAMPALSGAQEQKLISLREAIWRASDAAMKSQPLAPEAIQV